MRKGGVAVLAVVLLVVAIGSVGVYSQQANSDGGWTEQVLKGPVEDLLGYLYTASRLTGKYIRRGINTILPQKAQMPTSLDDPLGVLVLLTVFLAVAEVAKKVTWFLVAVGWVLMVIRVGIILARSYL